MIDGPLVLNTPWCKGQRLDTGAWLPGKKSSARGPVKKEKPRGSGALERKKI